MVSEDLIAKMVETARARAKSITPEQQAERERVDARNALLQEKGVKAPASGTFGRPPK